MRAIFIGALMLAVAVATGAITPSEGGGGSPTDIDAALPDAFGDWTPVEIAAAVLPLELETGSGEAVAYRAWRDPAGRVVTLVAAYGPPFGDSVRLHRPETCYRAQGFVVTARGTTDLELAGAAVTIIHLDTEKALRREAVTYWLRDGDAYAVHAGDHELLSLGADFTAVRDGALIRVSSAGVGAEGAFALHKAFLKDFTTALSPEGRRLLLAAGA